MNSRPYQVFRVYKFKDNSYLIDDELTIEPSAWHKGGITRIPKEHWNRIIEFAGKLDSFKAGKLFEISHHEPENVNKINFDELENLTKFLNSVIEEIRSYKLPLVEKPEITAWKDDWNQKYSYNSPPFWEAYENIEYVRMCISVKAVLERCVECKVPVYSYID